VPLYIDGDDGPMPAAPQQVAPNQLYNRFYGEMITTTDLKPKTKTTIQTKELIKLQAQLEITKKNMTIENAAKTIDLYECYIDKNNQDDKSIIHTLQDIKVVD
jgi:hypothetical protein